ncbi:CDP-Glycerol:Poly(glycerophosphate) glycerophosphotransferase [Lachnospiraceae bacterium XBB2008]|nr:CDP-Glycerol:Poly(glycerophosphate) glycerophosphotransferase [Lachnospiraceae bacterium XBB2008]
MEFEYDFFDYIEHKGKPVKPVNIMISERAYLFFRNAIAYIQSLLFRFFSLFPINSARIVFTCIEGRTGFSCNPKYIALELIRRESMIDSADRYQLIWLVNDTSKRFPSEIIVKRNSLFNRAYYLSTAHLWIDNSRKQLEVRKRRGQIYIQTWHAKLGFKPTGLDRGNSFSKMAYLISKHDSDMVDYWLSNSDWYDATLKTGSLYSGKILHTGSPRCDILVHAFSDEQYRRSIKLRLLESLGLPAEVDVHHFIMYAPTFRGGSQATRRMITESDHYPDFVRLKSAFENRFGGKWIILLRSHPQVIALNASDHSNKVNEDICYDISDADDMYEILAGCEAFLTDYSSAAFDASVMKIPVLLYCDDYKDYECERGQLLWDMRTLPFPFCTNNDELDKAIRCFEQTDYSLRLDRLFSETGMIESGRSAAQVADHIDTLMKSEGI